MRRNYTSPPIWERCKTDPALEKKRRDGLRKTRCVVHSFSERIPYLGGSGFMLKCRKCGKVTKAWGKYPEDYPRGGRKKKHD